ncbi:MAG: magnesium/cobalt transporter CorA [Xanthomonadales bacterium]|nr:magnesium/cobalt transporter CorA [Xanthomonadales bacterium]MCB1642903.1 magnesium/cobalt transporter CorA [Xanthomonadales bacterium]
MIRYFHPAPDGRRLIETTLLDGEVRPVWVDLYEPTEEEKRLIEERYGIDVPTRDEMAEIEPSNRLYQEDEALFMTATLVAQVEQEEPRSAPVTFILSPERLVTLRYINPRSFRTFAINAQRGQIIDARPEMILTSLLEVVINRFADILERVGSEVDQISRDVFDSAKPRAERRALNQLVDAIGLTGDLNSRVREALVSVARLVSYFSHPANGYSRSDEFREHIKSLGRDLAYLTDHASFQANKVQFILDATLGRISIEQNSIIKIFSVAAVVFLPPTLVASIYGMNFKFMPELDWPYGYPFAILLMILSAVVPYLFFKRKGWL